MADYADADPPYELTLAYAEALRTRDIAVNVILVSGWQQLKPQPLLPAEHLPNCVRIVLHHLVGKADEDRNGNDQQQSHHRPRAAQKPLGRLRALDLMHV